MNVETLSVALTGDAAGLSKATAEGSRAVQGFASNADAASKKAAASMDSWTRSLRQFKERAMQVGEGLNRIGHIGTAIAAAAAGFAVTAAQWDRGAERSMRGVKNAFDGLAVEVSHMLTPAIDKVAGHIESVVQWFKRLSPETRENVAHIGEMTVGFLALAGVAGKLSQLTGAIAGIGGALLPILPTVMGLAAGFFLIAAGIGEMNRAGSSIGEGLRRNLRGKQGVSTGKIDDDVLERMINGPKLEVKPGQSVMDRAAEDVAFTLGKITDKFKSLVPELAGLYKAATSTAPVDKGRRMNLDAERASKTAFERGLYESAQEWMDKQRAHEEENRKSRDAIIAATNAMDRENLDAQKALFLAVNETTESARVFGSQLTDLAQLTKAEADARIAAIQAVKNSQTGVFGKAVSQRGADVASTALGGGQIGGILQGLASGGIVGAIASLVSGTRPIARLVGTLSDAIQNFGDVLGPIVEPMVQTAAMFNAVAVVLKPFWKALASVAAIVEGPLLLILPTLYGGIKWLAVGILKVMQAITGVWNGVLSGLQNFIRNIADKLPAVLGDPLRGLVDGIEMFKDQTDYEAAIRDAAASKLGDFAAATDKAANAADKVAESLFNVPDGFKVNAARFNATNPAGGGWFGGSLAPATAVSPAATQQPVVNVYVGNKQVAAAVAVEAAEVKQAQIYVRTGRRVDPYGAGF